MSFSFCLSRPRLLLLNGVALLYQSLDCKKNGMLLRDHQRLLCAIAGYLTKFGASGAAEFKGLIASLGPPASPAMSGSGAGGATPSPRLNGHATNQTRYSGVNAEEADRFDAELVTQQERMRRATLHSMPPVAAVQQNANAGQHGVGVKQRQGSNASLPAEYRTTAFSQHLTPSGGGHQSSANSDSGSSAHDFVILETPSPIPTSQSPAQMAEQHFKQQHQNQQHQFKQPQQPQHANAGTSEWETLLSGLDSGSCNIFDAVYGGAPHGMDAGINNSLNSSGAGVGGMNMPLPDPIYIPAPAQNRTNGRHNNEGSVSGSSYHEEWDRLTEDSTGLTSSGQQSGVNIHGQGWDLDGMGVTALGMNSFDGFPASGVTDEGLSSDGESAGVQSGVDVFGGLDYKELAGFW